MSSPTPRVSSHAFLLQFCYCCTFSSSTGVALNNTQSLNLCVLSRVLWMQWNRGPVLSSASPTSAHLPSPRLLLEHCQDWSLPFEWVENAFSCFACRLQKLPEPVFSPGAVSPSPALCADLLPGCHCRRRAWPTSPLPSLCLAPASYAEVHFKHVLRRARLSVSKKAFNLHS